MTKSSSCRGGGAFVRDATDRLLGGRVVDEVGDAAGVVEQLAQGDAVPGAGEVGPAEADGVVEPQLALVHQGERRAAAERLRGAGDVHRVGGPRRPVAPDLGYSGRVHLEVAVALDHRDHSGRPAGHGDEALECLVEGGVLGDRAWRLRDGLAGARQHEEHGQQRRHQHSLHGG